MVSHNVLREPLAGSERRRYERLALPGRCWIESDELTLCAPMADIGKGGLFLRTAVPVLTGSVVDVWLLVQGETDALSARGMITRAVPARSGLPHGIGVEFLEILQGARSFASLIAKPSPLPWLRAH